MGIRLHGPNMRVQPALVPGGLVFMDQAAARCLIDFRHGLRVSSLRLFFLSRLDRINHFLDKRTHMRALACIMLASLFRLAGALSGLS